MVAEGKGETHDEKAEVDVVEEDVWKE